MDPASPEFRAEQARLLAAARDGSWTVADMGRFHELAALGTRYRAAEINDPAYALELEAWARDHDDSAAYFARVASLDTALHSDEGGWS